MRSFLGRAAACMTLGLSAAGHANAQESASAAATASQGRDGEYCRLIDLEEHNGGDLTIEFVQEAVSECIAVRSRELRASDRRTRTLSRTSALGGLGALASGLTAQAAGTTNAWVAIGLAPVLADDVQQRQRVSAIRHDFLARLEQLQCRAKFLDDNMDDLQTQSTALSGAIQSIENQVESILDDLPPQVREGSREYALVGILEEALRIVEEARFLQSNVASLSDEGEIARLEAIAYNYLAREYESMRRGTLARPEVTFRSIIASPLRLAARVVEGSGSPPATYTYQAFVTPDNRTFAGRYRVTIDVVPEELRSMDLRMEAPHHFRAPSQYRALAEQVRADARELAAQSAQLRRDLLLFVDAAVEEDPAACPTYRLSERAVAAPPPPAPRAEPVAQPERTPVLPIEQIETERR